MTATPAPQPGTSSAGPISRPIAGGHPERVEEVAGDPEAVDVTNFAGPSDRLKRVSPKASIEENACCRRSKRLVLRQGDLTVTAGVPSGAAVTGQAHLDELVRRAHRQRAQAERVQQLEDRGVGADAERQRHDRGERRIRAACAAGESPAADRAAGFRPTRCGGYRGTPLSAARHRQSHAAPRCGPLPASCRPAMFASTCRSR